MSAAMQPSVSKKEQLGVIPPGHLQTRSPEMVIHSSTKYRRLDRMVREKAEIRIGNLSGIS